MAVLLLSITLLLSFTPSWSQFSQLHETPNGASISLDGKATIQYSTSTCNSGGERVHFGGERNYKTQCSGPLTWIRGLEPQVDPSQPLAMICSTSPLLRHAVQYATILLKPGQSFKGGDFTSPNGIGFDAVINIKNVSVRWEAFPALPPQPVPVYPVVPTASCFASDQQVQTPAGLKLMKDLKIGDKVLSWTAYPHKLRYSTVTSFLHHLPQQMTQFLKLETETGETMTLTPTHMIYAAPCHTEILNYPRIFAKDVRPGKDCVLRVINKGHNLDLPLPAIVNSSQLISVIGAYGPLTLDGDMVVNGLAASCHAIVNDNLLIDAILRVSSKLRSLWSSVSGSDTEFMQIPSTIEYLLSIFPLIIPSLI